MTDVLTADQRRYNMSRIRGTDTTTEMIVRRGLHARGLRYRLHAGHLPGRPDLVFARFASVIFVHGCFWHGHRCSRFRWPRTHQDFWRAKIQKNQARDRHASAALLREHWRVLTVWECALRGPARKQLEEVLDLCVAFLERHEQTNAEIHSMG